MSKTAKAKSKSISKTKKKAKLASALSGVAGEFFVAAELSRRGYIATLTQRNAKGIDILVSNADGSKLASLQVKTNQKSQTYWLLNDKAELLTSPQLFYVMVNLVGSSGHPEYHIVPSNIVAKEITDSHREWLRTPGKKGQARKDNTMRQIPMPEGKYIGRWDLLGLD
jgi:hypothetical protein